MSIRNEAVRRSEATALMRQAAALLDEEQDGYILMRLQHAIDEAEADDSVDASATLTNQAADQVSGIASSAGTSSSTA